MLCGQYRHRNHSVRGPPPTIEILKTENEEVECVSKWIGDRAKEGVVPHEFAVFVRSVAQLPRARAAVEKSGIPFKILDESVAVTSNYASISTIEHRNGIAPLL